MKISRYAYLFCFVLYFSSLLYCIRIYSVIFKKLRTYSPTINLLFSCKLSHDQTSRDLEMAGMIAAAVAAASKTPTNTRKSRNNSDSFFYVHVDSCKVGHFSPSPGAGASTQYSTSPGPGISTDICIDPPPDTADR